MDNLPLHHLAVLLAVKLRKPCLITLVSGENFCCDVTVGGSSLRTKQFLTFRLMTTGHVAESFVDPIVPTNYEFSSSQASSDAPALSHSTIYLTSRT